MENNISLTRRDVQRNDMSSGCQAHIRVPLLRFWFSSPHCFQYRCHHTNVLHCFQTTFPLCIFFPLLRFWSTIVFLPEMFYVHPIVLNLVNHSELIHTSYLSFFLHMAHFWLQFFSTQKARKSRQNRFHGKTA